MTNVKRYIDRLGYTGDRKLTSVDNYDNFFYDILQLTERSSLCEDDLYSNEHMIHGKMDLNAGVVVDYKTSKKMKTTAEIMDGMIRGGKDIDLQAIFYLALAYEKWSGNEMQFMFTMGHDTQQSDEGFDVMNNVHRVVIYDPDVDSYSLDDCKAYTFGLRNGSNCGKDPYRFVEIINRIATGPRSEWMFDDVLIKAIADEFEYRLNQSGKTTITNAIKQYVEILDSGIFVRENLVIVMKDCMERMLLHVDELHAKMSSESITVLPPEPIGKCSDCDYFSVCTKDVLKADGGDSDE